MLSSRKLLLIAAAILALALAACGDDDSGDSGDSGGSGGSGESADSGGDCGKFSVGIFGPLTGSAGVYGQAGVDAAEQVISEFEKSNPNCDIELVRFDSQGDPAQAPGLARKAGEDESMVAVLGPAFSGELEAAAPIFEEATMPFITADATDPSLSENDWQFFHRTIAHDGQEGPADAEYLVNDLKAKRVVVIDNGQAYGKGLGNVVREELEKAGAEVVSSESIDANRNDYSPTVNNIRAADADAVFCGCLYPEAARLIKQLRAAGDDTPYMGGSGLLVPDLVKQAGADAVEGTVIASAGVDPTLSDKGKTWLEEWKAFHDGEDPGLFAPEWYNATVAVTEAIGAGNTSREDINEYLANTQFEGATGPFEFDENGDIRTAEVIFYVVKDGEFTFQKTVEQ